MLLDLGAMWCAQDYAQAGHYFQQALDLARISGDGQMVAHSLNRVGNWHVNLDEPHAALSCHLEALLTFRDAEDSRGQAATFDCLGMASFNCGDLVGSMRYYEQALALSQVLNDRAAMSSIWANLTYSGGSYLTETLVWEPTPLSEEARTGESARQLARQVGWRAGEAYALIALGQTHGYRGDYRRALAYISEALAIAEAIDHREWMAAAHCGLGRFYLDSIGPGRRPAARNSGLGFGATGRVGHLAPIERCAPGHRPPGAGRAAEGRRCAGRCSGDGRYGIHTDGPYLPVGKSAAGADGRQAGPCTTGSGRSDCHDPQRGTRGHPASTSAAPGARRGIDGSGKGDGGRDCAPDGSSGRRRAGGRALQWRILAQLATLYQSQGRHVEAAATTETAWVLIEQVAGTIPEEGVRVLLIERAKRRLGIVAPRRRGRAAPSAGGFKSGGLTAREVEIAKLITQGRSNREIAARLLITERTVTTHISHIFNRLGFITRTRIAAWVAGQGWNEPDKSSD